MSLELRLDARELEALAKRAEGVLDGSTLLKALGLRYLKWIDDNFRSQGRKGGRAWRRLRPNTVAGRRKGSSAILQDTGRYKQSFSLPRAVLNVAADQVTAGSAAKIGPFHELGTAPYKIVPRTAKVLAFMTVKGPAFARSVRHPGLPKRPVLPNKRVAERVAVDLIEAALRRLDR